MLSVHSPDLGIYLERHVPARDSRYPDLRMVASSRKKVEPPWWLKKLTPQETAYRNRMNKIRAIVELIRCGTVTQQGIADALGTTRRYVRELVGMAKKQGIMIEQNFFGQYRIEHPPC